MNSNNNIVAGGGEADFMTVRQLTARGSQIEIGRVLAEEARSGYGWRPQPADPLRAGARLDWFERNWPQHHARMLGAAETLGIDIRSAYLDGLTGTPEGSACSSTFYPPQITENGHGLLGRNYDFFTTSAAALFGMLSGRTVENSGPPMAGRPYVVTTVTDDGPATTVLTMNELDCCMEGINEHGLAVALLIADAETAGEPVVNEPQVGLSSTQLPRFVLETCATADEAKRALLGAKQYDLGTPLHYLIADAEGNSFVWEHGPGGDEHIVESDGGALCVTNHLLHRHPDPATLPEDTEETLRTYERYRTLRKRAVEPATTGAALRSTLDEIGFTAANSTLYPMRTLWRSVFDLTERTMSTRFYLGERPDGEARHSEELTFTPGTSR